MKEKDKVKMEKSSLCKKLDKKMLKAMWNAESQNIHLYYYLILTSCICYDDLFL